MIRNIFLLCRNFSTEGDAAGRLAVDLAQHLAERHHVHVVAGYVDSPAGKRQQSFKKRDITVHQIPMLVAQSDSRSLRIFNDVLFYFGETWHFLRRASPGDVVIVLHDTPLLGLLATRLLRTKKVNMVNWMVQLLPETEAATAADDAVPIYKRWSKTGRNQLLRDAAVNVVAGPAMAKRLQDEGIPASKLAVIPPWFDRSKAALPTTDTSPRPAEWDGKFVVGYCGSLGSENDFKTLIGAAELLKDKPDILFFIMGTGSQRYWLRATATLRHLSNIILELPSDEAELNRMLMLTDAHIITLKAELEGFLIPEAVFRSVAAKRPICFVGDLEGDVAHLIEENQLGYVFANGDAEQLANTIEMMAGSPVLQQAINKSIRSRPADSAGKRTALTQWRKLINDVTHTQTQGAPVGGQVV